MSSIFHVLLTGGVGSRLWPLSRQSRPKQYLEIFSQHSLFELAVQRNASFVNDLIVVGNKGNRNLSETTLSKIGISDYVNIVEATPRNTAPAIAFAAFAAQPEDILLVTPADHIIKEGREYDGAVQKAIKLAQENNIVTFGIEPTRPETGYGYIEFEGEEVISFREKPNEDTAKDFLKRRSFLWNSGMFCFKAGIFLEELQNYSPEVYKRSLAAWKKSANGELETESSLDIPSISVDYAVMERSNRIKVVRSDFQWSDMGSFEAVYDYLKEQGQPVDKFGNMQIGSDKHVSFVGLTNCILVSTDDAYLVLSKAASQEVKELYQELEKKNIELVR
ncbi:sugar phosphate nucleotidyltransferase [Zunongwangia sp. F260]|uniref:Sugar phosphate nucleotidyltransferase n=1 Tax=Autumnicola lenta TaxID=3075593 RepID=A0ABU3CM38_9FLAO|nr:sugar phosphate nucleotidyltransferase [Zunongwangia sp. F260]MDT0647419.1 sugar phosphate nucleotidyltransferase [Zunongwangia sp. F260]